MAKRTPAPKARLRSRWVDRRTEMLSQLDKDHPEFTHVFQDPNTDADTMQLNGYEWVLGNTYDKSSENTERVGFRQDKVARILREEYEGLLIDQEQESFETVESLYCKPTETDELGRKVGNEEWDKNSSGPGRKIASPKDPAKIENIGGE